MSHPRPRYGHRIHVLPPGAIHYAALGAAYYFMDGLFYMAAASGGYVVTEAPMGFTVATLPLGFTTYYYMNTPYYYYMGTYYLWNNDAQLYEVVTPPDPVQAMVNDDLAVADDDDDGGDLDDRDDDDDDDDRDDQNVQANSKEEQDRLDCHRWGIYESGFDPMDEGAAAKATGAQVNQYNTTFLKCMKARGYAPAK